MDRIRFTLDELTELGTGILEHHGVPHDDAELVARSLAVSDGWGHPSHGMLRLGWYVARLRNGVMRARTETRTVIDAGALVVLDGREGVGQVVTDRACALAVERARTYGAGVVAVRRSNHFGTAAYWTRRMADAGAVGILTTNGSPAMAPWGGTVKTVGANPWSIAAPGPDGRGVVLDIANTNVARGKIYAARERGERIPENWATDSDGVPTTDPDAAIDGILLPVGGHKGYGISFMMDVLSGVLTGSATGTAVAGPYVPDQESGCGHLVIAIDIERAGGRDRFDSSFAQLLDSTRSVPTAPGVDAIRVPGEPENAALERAERDGVELPATTVLELQRLAAEASVPFGAAHPLREEV